MLYKKNTIRTALIDGDIIAYRAAYFAEKDGEDELALPGLLTSLVNGWATHSFCKNIIVCLTVGKSFRHELCTEYKAHRPDVKPEYLGLCYELMPTLFKCVSVPTLEADDVMGILATNGKVKNPIIVSIDKDLRQIPCWLSDPDKDDFPYRITEDEADYWRHMQWLTGDTSDGYKGIPGIGPKKAEKILATDFPLNYAVHKAYEQAGLDAEYCTLMGKLSKILRSSDWDPKEKAIVW